MHSTLLAQNGPQSVSVFDYNSLCVSDLVKLALLVKHCFVFDLLVCFFVLSPQSIDILYIRR